MKTAEEWAVANYPNVNKALRSRLIVDYRQIQADALRSTADMLTQTTQDHQSVIANLLYKAKQLEC